MLNSLQPIIDGKNMNHQKLLVLEYKHARIKRIVIYLNFD